MWTMPGNAIVPTTQPVKDEVCRYVVHGVLHLLGYHDGDPEGVQQMRRKEEYYLESR